MNTKISSPTFTGLYIIPNNKQSQEVVNLIKESACKGQSESQGLNYSYREALNAIIVIFRDINQIQKEYTDNFAAYVKIMKERFAEQLLLKQLIKENIPYYYGNNEQVLELTRNPEKISNIAYSLNSGRPINLADLPVNDVNYYRH